MSIRTTILAVAACGALATACASSPYVNSPAWLTADNSPVWTQPQRADFIETITPGETTLGEVTAMYGPAMAFTGDADGDQFTSDLYWYGKTGLNQPWAAVTVPGDYDQWSDATIILAASTSEGLEKTREDATAGRSASLPQAPVDPGTPAPASAPSPAAGTLPAGAGGDAPMGDASAAALADDHVGPGDVSDALAAEMAAFGETGASITDFRARYGAEAEYSEDRRMFRKVGSTLYYGSAYDSGPSIWVEFDGNDVYRSTMIDVPRSGNQAAYQRLF